MKESFQNIISKDTLIPLGLVCTLLFAAYSFGLMSSRFDNFTKIVEEIKQDVKELRQSGGTTFYTDYDSVTDFCTKFVRTF